MKVFAGKEAGVRVGRAMIGITVLGLVAACSPSAEETPTPSPPTSMTATPTTERPSPTPDPTTESPTPTPTPSETLDADQIAARDVVNEFFRLSDELRQSPEAPLQPLMDITSGRAQEVHVSAIVDLWDAGAMQIGNVSWVLTDIAEVTEGGTGKSVTISACTDNSGTDAVDVQSRESILDPDRPVFIDWDMSMVMEGEFWKVSDTSTDPVESCSQ